MENIDEFLQHALELKADDEWLSALIEVSDPAWNPPRELSEGIRITSRLGNVISASLTKRAILALAADPLVRMIEGSFDVPQGRVSEEEAAEA